MGYHSRDTSCNLRLAKSGNADSELYYSLPTYLPEDSKARVDTLDSIVTLVMLQTMTRPTVLPLDRLVLQKTTLGKISQAKIRTAYERGDYAQYQELDDESIKLYNASRDPNAARPSTKMEILVLGEFCEIFNLRAEDMDIDRSIFGMGITSVDLIRLKRNIEVLGFGNLFPTSS